MNQPTSFMQTEAWEQFQRAQGRATYRLDGTLYIRHALRWGADYWYAPRFDTVTEVDRLDSVFKTKTKFILAEPQAAELATPWQPIPSRQPRQTLITRLDQPTEKILARMKSKTRYNIGLAERKGVTINHLNAAESMQYLPTFLGLTQETNLRNQIRSHPEQYYQQLVGTLGPAGLATVHIASANNQVVSALILIRHAQTATYLFGASSSADRNLMASYLLQWQTMQWAKEQGDTAYDWWGIRVDPEMAAGQYTEDANLDQIVPSPGKSFGVTRFKLGFGGRVHIYPSAYVRSYSTFWYNAFKLRSQPGSFSY